MRPWSNAALAGREPRVPERVQRKATGRVPRRAPTANAALRRLRPANDEAPECACLWGALPEPTQGRTAEGGCLRCRFRGPSRWALSRSRLGKPSRPRGGGTSTSQGRPYAIFRRALERKNLLVAEATAKELPPLNLTDALELTVLIARKDPRRHPRVAARWLLRFLEENGEVTIAEATLAASCLAALVGNSYLEAAQALRDMTDKATRRRGERGVA